MRSDEVQRLWDAVSGYVLEEHRDAACDAFVGALPRDVYLDMYNASRDLAQSWESLYLRRSRMFGSEIEGSRR